MAMGESPGGRKGAAPGVDGALTVVGGTGAETQINRGGSHQDRKRHRNPTLAVRGRWC